MKILLFRFFRWNQRSRLIQFFVKAFGYKNSKQPNTEPRLLNIYQLSAATGLSVRTLYRYKSQNRVPFLQSQKKFRLLFSLEDVVEALKNTLNRRGNE